MNVTLETPAFPISIGNGVTTKAESTFLIQHHDSTFRSVSMLDEASNILYTVTSKGPSSLSWRRSIKDASGRHVFDLCHFGMGIKNKWGISDASGQEIGALRHASMLSGPRSALDGDVKNLAEKGAGNVKASMRPRDASGLTMDIALEGVRVAELQLIENNDIPNLRKQGMNRSVWRVRVAKGLDLALVSCVFSCGPASLDSADEREWKDPDTRPLSYGIASYVETARLGLDSHAAIFVGQSWQRCGSAMSCGEQVFAATRRLAVLAS